MQAPAEHYHAEAKYTGHPDGDEDRPYRDLDSALGRAEEVLAALRPNGYLVEQTDTGNDDVGVIREYHGGAGRDADRCHRGPHLPRGGPHMTPSKRE